MPTRLPSANTSRNVFAAHASVIIFYSLFRSLCLHVRFIANLYLLALLWGERTFLWRQRAREGGEKEKLKFGKNPPFNDLFAEMLHVLTIKFQVLTKLSLLLIKFILWMTQKWNNTLYYYWPLAHLLFLITSLFLPLYSPMTNPIEEASSKIEISLQEIFWLILPKLNNFSLDSHSFKVISRVRVTWWIILIYVISCNRKLLFWIDKFTSQ